MAQKYFTVITKVGAAKLANAAALGSQLQLSAMAVGDGGGAEIVPADTAAGLTREVYRGGLNRLEVDPNNSNQIIAELVIQEDVGNFTVREVGLFDVAGSLIAIGNTPETFKPVASSGSARSQIVRMVIQLDNVGGVALKIDPSVVVATREYVDTVLSKTVEKVSSIADLRASRLKAESVVVAGYYAGAPGVGGGVFVLDAGNKTAADDGGLVIVDAQGGRWRRLILSESAALSDFGILPNGKDVGADINRAFDSCAGKYTLVAAAGTYITSVELKAPTGLRFRGAGMYRTLIKVASNMPAIANVITNKSNNYATRSAVDHSIHISDIGVDADWRGRYAIGAHINNQACGVKLSAVKHSSLINVRVINAALHCFDVCADQYFDNGDIAANAVNQSEYITVKSCVAENPYRDDCFTVHNSRYITFENCLAIHDGTVSALGNTQQGFEADEGSLNISVIDCVADGLMCGFQSKGHVTTKPAERTVFQNITAKKCTIGYMASVGTNPEGKTGYRKQSVVVDGLTVIDSVGRLNYPQPIAAHVYGADGVVMNNVTVDSESNVVIEEGAGFVEINNLQFLRELPQSFAALVDIKATNNGNCRVFINQFNQRLPQKISAVAKLSKLAQVYIGASTFSGFPSGGSSAIDLERSNRDVVRDVVSNYSFSVNLRGEAALTGEVILQMYGKILMGGNPVLVSPPTKAPYATVMTSQHGEEWVQRSMDPNNPNWVKTRLA